MTSPDPDSIYLPLPGAGMLTAAALTSFIGRGSDLAAIEALFASGRRLVTLVGPAGMGKTRLALRFAALARDASKQDVRVCDLTAARDKDALLTAVAGCLGLPVTPGIIMGDLARSIRHALGARGRALLVLDNLEQLLPEAADAVASWLSSAGEAMILITSRERLHVSGEAVHELLPLPEAMDLFVDRVRCIQPGYVPDPEDLPIIGEILARLDGIPLAIELAAARARLLSPREMLTRLERRFELLACGPRDRCARQVTMRGALQWSWELLDAHERAALAAMSVFQGGFTLDAAEHVIGAWRAPEAPPVLDLLQALCDKSLLRSQPAGRSGDPVRFGLYETLAAFAAEKLTEQGALGLCRQFGELAPHAWRAPTPHSLELTVSRDAMWFQLGDGEPVDLSRRSVLRLLLAALCDRAEAARDAPIDVNELIRIGWPGQRMVRSVALNRLHVALAALRTRGLREVLERRGEGYRLHPGVIVVRAACA